jgi:hypothetical protein
MDRPKEYQSLLPQNEAYPIGSETREIRLALPAPRSVQSVFALTSERCYFVGI